ncbi:MAG: TolC family protein [Spirochaetales bacterium]|nr:MAG: TolC family protein [Spirochaetales bacterium]
MRKIFYFPLFAGIFLLSGFYTQAEDIEVSAESAVELALKNNLSLSSEVLAVGQKKRTQDTVWSYFLPAVSVNASLFRPNQSPMGLPDDPITWSLSAGFTATLALNAQLFAGIQSSILAYQAGTIKLEQAKKALEKDVQKAFYNILLLKENISIMEQSIKSAENRYNQALINYQNGYVPRLSMLSAQVAWANLKPNFNEMETQYREVVRSFKLLIGLDPADGIVLDGEIKAQPVNLDAGQLFDAHAARRFDVRTLANSIESLRNLNSQNYASFTPTVSLRYSMDPSFNKDPFADAWFEDPENDWSQRTGGFSVTISIPLDSLIPGSRTWTSIANTKDSIRQSEIGLTQTLRNAEAEIANIVNRLKKSSESIDVLKANTALAEEAYMLAEEAYNAGSRELLEVQNAELELKKSKLQVITEEYTYVTSLLDLEYALNASVEELGVVK